MLYEAEFLLPIDCISCVMIACITVKLFSLFLGPSQRERTIHVAVATYAISVGIGGCC